MPNYPGLSIGGVLSVGGIGDTTFRTGTAGAAVRALQVVTGTGEILDCSADRHGDLFSACLGGFGQFGVISAVEMALVEAPPAQRMCRFLYLDAASYAQDFERLMLRSDLFEALIGCLVPNTRTWVEYVMGSASRMLWIRPQEHPWLFAMEARYRTDRPDAAAIETELASLDHLPMARTDRDLTGFLQLDPPPVRDDAQSLWLHIITPTNRVSELLAYALGRLDVDPVNDGPVVVYPLVRSKLSQTSFRMPDAETALLFDIMPIVPFVHADRAERLLPVLHDIWDYAKTLGALCYPVGAVRYTKEDWVRHLGEKWNWWKEVKRRYDPNNVLGAGPCIFHDA
jgi:FAD/FMN-containing dehydrogenase